MTAPRREHKYDYLFIVQGEYTRQWDDVYATASQREARSILKDYRDNDLGTAYRIFQRRELINQ